MYNALPSGLPQLKKIVLLIFGVIVCLASYTGIRAITGTTSLRIAASSTGNILTGSLVQTSDNAISRTNPARTLSFAERVTYQRDIEEVYWRHRIWPKERPDSKPALEAGMSRPQLENKVRDYLLKSRLLADYWHRPLTGEQLQAEMDRMARYTKQPEVLRELFAALGNDPFVIAECLARPALAERLLANWYAYDERIHGEVKHRAEAQLSTHGSIEQMKQTSEMYREIELVKGNNVPDEIDRSASHGVKLNSAEWDETVQRLAPMYTEHGPKSLAEAYESMPIGRISSLQEDETSYYATAILSKAADRLKLATVAWLKEPLAPWLARAENQVNTAITVPNGNYTLPENSGSVGGCTEDTWTATSGPPDTRGGHTAVWTGSEMIVWGGVGSSSFTYSNTGGRYDPSTDNWTSTATTNAPDGRYGHTAVWTGTEMIVWGGIAGTGTARNGARYNPGTNSWTATSLTNAPSARSGHTAVWSGNEMIVWGGDFFDTTTHYLNTGGRYNPVSNSWTATSLIDAPSARSVHTAVWTGNQMIVWGGVSNGVGVDTGGRYNPGTNSWIATTTANSPDPREYHTAVWTGNAMIIWGGDNGGVPFRTGGKYFPATDTWLATTVTNAPLARSGYTAVWTGQEMIIWGGFGGGNYLRTGAKYNPGANSWTATGTTNAPTGRSGHTAIWSGTEMIIWGGQTPGNTNTGGRYNPNSNSWTPISNTPTPRRYHAAVWTGTEMIIWGGIVPFSIDPAFYTNTGGKYDPSTDNWTATNTIRAPTGRELPTAVWTGSEMIVWGGYSYNGADHFWNTGGRYNPATDSWVGTSITNAPGGREAHTAVWTGSAMIVWGGLDVLPNGFTHDLNTGGIYDPRANSWTATSIVQAPSARDSHAAVWTGSEMIIWGSTNDTSGGRYNATTNSWIATTPK